MLAIGGSSCGPGTRPLATVIEAANDAGVDDSGTYHSPSAYTCCGPGEGLTCCSARAGLLGYDLEPDGAIVPVGDLQAGPEANCFPYGGIVGTCADDSDTFAGEDPCTICCAGLTRVNVSVADDDAGPNACQPVLALFTCLPCGNGICERSEENRCTCPADCP
jgi:hypothetical protein